MLKDFNSFDKFKGLISINENQNFIIDAQILTSENDSSLTLAQAIIFALIGGLILNLMPCVFPVISLKGFKFCFFK